MSDKIIVLDDGRKRREGTPTEIYDEPSNSFVANFVGKSTRLEGTVSSRNPPTVDTRVGTVPVGSSALDGIENGTKIEVFLRPEDVRIVNPNGSTDGTLHGTVSNVEYLGTHSEILVDIGEGIEAIVHTSTSEVVEVGDDVALAFDPSNVIVLGE